VSDARRLVQWFQANARSLPWRTEDRDPYRTLVSALMLQQTQVDRVVPRYEAFLDRFPTLGVLAAAQQDEVLEAWSGLGYYRRARLLHALSREIADGPGELPGTAAELEKLPGIGPYTAAAVASLVYGEAAPVLDGNVARVGSRVLVLSDDPRRAAGKRRVLEWVLRLMDDAPPGPVNEALMELGASVCTPTDPRCRACPFEETCGARSEGRPEAYPPVRKTRDAVELEWLFAIVEDHAGSWLLKSVESGPILRGLWLPPFGEIDRERSLDDQLAELLPFEVSGPVEALGPIRHSITHRRILVTPMRLLVDSQPSVADGWRWVNPAAPGLPTSSLLAKLTASAARGPGEEK
jgi:A/G-specific adenine glycosylase